MKRLALLLCLAACGGADAGALREQPVCSGCFWVADGYAYCTGNVATALSGCAALDCAERDVAVGCGVVHGCLYRCGP